MIMTNTGKEVRRFNPDFFLIAETDNEVYILFYIFTSKVFTILYLIRKINLK